MKRLTWLLALLAAASAFAQPKVADGRLVDDKGMTLYVWDNDLTVPGKSACTGVCVANWPPVVAQPGAKPEGDFALLVRDDGTVQWTYKGRPLYRWVNDQKPGDMTGDGFRGGTWHVARP